MNRIFYLMILSGMMFCLASSSNLANAGLIDVVAVEDKGTITIKIGHNEFQSYMRVTLHEPDWGERAGTYVRLNRETFVIDRIITVHFWNEYPSQIHIPQPIILGDEITIPFFMATGPSATDLGPLPTGSILSSASMQDGYGNFHNATITSFFDVFADLPLTGPHGETYIWDRSGFTTTQGNFWLSQVTMSADQLSVPAPSALLLGALGLGTAVSVLRRRKALR